MARAIDSEAAYRFLSEQFVKETGAFSKGVNKGLNIARSAMRNPDAIPALRPVSREQVEKVPRCEHCKDGKSFDGQVVIMGNKGMFPLNFCPRCGSPLTDEAVEMVMERLEKMHADRDT